VTTIDHDTIANNPTIQAKVLNAPARSGSVRFVTYVRFFGNTLGGKYVETDEFAFPVDICKGCLIAFSPADIRPGYAAPNCLQNFTASAGAMSQSSLPCIVGQDLQIDCIQCQDVADCHGAVQGVIVDAGGGG
jgi:hypothetical protein